MSGIITKRRITEHVFATYDNYLHLIKIFRDNALIESIPMGEHYTECDFEKWVELRIEKSNY